MDDSGDAPTPMQGLFGKTPPTRTQTQLGRGGEYRVCCVSGVDIGEDEPLELKAQVRSGGGVEVLAMTVGLESY